MPPDVNREYRRAVGIAAAAALFIMVLAGLLAPIGVVGHLRGMASNMCGTLAHMASDVASLMLLALASSAVVAGLATIAASTVLGLRIRAQWRAGESNTARRVRQIARRAGIRARVVVFSHHDSIACSRGIIRPSIWVSDTSVGQLSDDELIAVLSHEQHHCDHSDPLRLLALRILSRTLFALPLVDAARRRFERAAEFAADDTARARVGSRSTASALLKFATSDPVPLAAQFGAVTVVERVQRLLGDAPPAVDNSRSAVATALIVALTVACVVLVLSLPAMG